jgi:hypothetical protein
MNEPSSSRCATMLRCEGWWEETGYGRQPMLDLKIGFSDGQIAGLGRDIIGSFTFSGSLSEAGQVGMVKQYIGKHRVAYIGSYDGEGTMWGHWQIGIDTGRWLIAFRRATAETTAIQELVATACPSSHVHAGGEPAGTNRRRR